MPWHTKEPAVSAGCTRLVIRTTFFLFAIALLGNEPGSRVSIHCSHSADSESEMLMHSKSRPCCPWERKERQRIVLPHIHRQERKEFEDSSSCRPFVRDMESRVERKMRMRRRGCRWDGRRNRCPAIHRHRDTKRPSERMFPNFVRTVCVKS